MQRLVTRPWLAVSLFMVTIVILAGALRDSSGLEINTPSLPWRFVEATWGMSAIVIPFLSIFLALLVDSPWRAFWNTWRSLLFTFVLSATMIWLILVIQSRGRIAAQAPEPLLFALGGFSATLFLGTASTVAGVFLGSMARWAGRYRMVAGILAALTLMVIEGLSLQPYLLPLRVFYNITIGGAGLSQSWGIPASGLIFPWSTYIIILTVSAGIALPALVVLFAQSKENKILKS